MLEALNFSSFIPPLGSLGEAIITHERIGNTYVSLDHLLEGLYPAGCARACCDQCSWRVFGHVHANHGTLPM